VILAHTERTLVRAALLVATLLTTTSSRAQTAPPRALLVVTRQEGTEDCPDANAVAMQLRALAPTSEVDTRAQNLQDTWIQVEMTRTLGSYHAEIVARGRRQGRRALTDIGPGCSSLGDALAILLAMLIDPDERVAAIQPEVIARRPIARAAREPDHAPRELYLVAGGGGALRLLEHPVPFGALALRARAAPMLTLEAGGALLSSDQVESGSGSVGLSLAYGYVFLCASVLGGRESASLALCLQPMLGSLGGSGQGGYQDRRTERWPWLALGAGPEAFGPLAGRLSWFVRSIGLAPLIRRGFSVLQTNGDRRDPFRTPSFGVELALGLAVEL
jgi:hypothetical protein